ncbi:hypothetical protein MASR2M69_03820 [Bacteroidota bacterium]
MKNLRYITTLVLLLVLVVSCNQDEIKPYINSSDIGAVDASFRSTLLVYGLSQADNGKVNVLINRGNTKDAATVPITISGTGTSKFSLQSNSVTFAAGEGSAYVVVNYSISSVAPATKYTFTLTIADDTMVSKSKVKTINVEAMLPLNYVAFGNGTYSSEFYEGTWSQPVQKANISATLNFYKLTNCYEPGYNIEFKVDNGVLTCAQQNIGWQYSASYGYVFVSPQTTEITGKDHIWYSKFVLPTAGLAFSGTYKEMFTMP